MTSHALAVDMEHRVLPWMEPLDASSALGDQDYCLLYSGRSGPQTGRYSYLAVEPIEELKADSLNALDEMNPEEQWFGTIAYEALHDCEMLDEVTDTHLPFSSVHFTRFQHVYVFDHEEKNVTCSCGSPDLISHTADDTDVPTVKELASNMTKARYLKAVRDTVAQIQAGAFYQANITRKFTGKLEHANAFNIFKRLCEISPSPYSVYIRRGSQTIISSSPELFLEQTPERGLVSRPIKGTLGNAESAQTLAQSEKDRAENLMIVDLMRNDFARVCDPNSIKVEDLYSIQSFSTLHHMVSCVKGTLQSGIVTSDILRATFPPGSMTGAPKIAAMQWCMQQESIQRGMYSGAIGWIKPGHSMDLSVVIRTIVIDGDRFEFQVGGGIVADSDSEKEWEETLVKAKGISAALGISREQLAAL